MAMTFARATAMHACAFVAEFRGRGKGGGEGENFNERPSRELGGGSLYVYPRFTRSL